ncbi:hypothetical protein IQ265_13460 [Nodosilinea sp. LEGE 06152]|uniref:hypothetical protein n=1 Tax=Nodosilinea sp. LEGE 06152 TaxID=2777966 RepID=UPI0018813B53|nr:hypothetical protein [Nodosilinea sp. LEGE 06152]MBE9157822.1 hypothetical protein [Nodosilinea sp. LEGE 06152]
MGWGRNGLPGVVATLGHLASGRGGQSGWGGGAGPMCRRGGAIAKTTGISLGNRWLPIR